MNVNLLQPDDTGAKPVAEQLPKVRKALSRLKRELSDEELATPGVQKMLVEELERVEDENNDLKNFREKFNTADKDLAVANQKLKGWQSMEIISTGCIAVGAAALVYVPEAWKTQPNGWIALIFGGVLTVIGIVAKAIRL
jgi:septal ring factor EnvC (AmiA/AmiB activator)